MSKLNKLSFVLLLTSAMLFIGCRKKGCIDEYALNYSAEAKSDDGSLILLN